MIKLDELKGKMSIRALYELRRLGYTYLEEVNIDVVNKNVYGKKTKKEILDFIGGLKKC